MIFYRDFSFLDSDDAHALVRRACHRLVQDCTGVTRSTPAEDRRRFIIGLSRHAVALA